MTLSRGAQRCLELLRDYSRKHRGRVFPFQATLAKHLGKTDRQVRNYLSELKEAGLVQVHKQGQTSATYELSNGQLQVVENKSDGKENFRSVSGLFPVCGSPVSITYSSTELQEQASAPAGLSHLVHRKNWDLGPFPEPLIEKPGGRVEVNPDLRRLQGALENASGRIRRARNPIAYERGVIQRELAGQKEASSGSKQSRCIDEGIGRGDRRHVPVPPLDAGAGGQRQDSPGSSDRRRAADRAERSAVSGSERSYSQASGGADGLQQRHHAQRQVLSPETQRKPPLPCLEWVAAVDADVGALAARKVLR